MPIPPPPSGTIVMPPNGSIPPPPSGTVMSGSMPPPPSPDASESNSSYLNLGDDWQGIKNFAKQTPLGLLSGLRHPGDTIKSLGKSIVNPYDPDGLAAKMIVPTVKNTVDELHEANEARKQGSYGAAAAHTIQSIPIVGQVMKSAGEDMNVSPIGDNGQRDDSYGAGLKNLLSSPKSMGTLAGGAATLALPAAKGIAKIGGGPALEAAGEAATAVPRAIRSAAIGDPDAAAVRGLKIPAGSPKMQRTISSVQTARPYLQGVTSQAELQERIPAAKAEIWSPYQQAVEAGKDTQVRGPDGVTTLGELESERLQLSALNRALKMREPEAVQLAQQKGMTQAQLLDREAAVKAALDPELEKMGVKPAEIRKTFGAVAQIGQRISGKDNIIEPKTNYGFSKLKDLSLTKPLSNLPVIGSAARDIAAGRYMSASPIDTGIREGFRIALPKPDLGRFTPFEPKGLLPEPMQTIPLHGGGEVAGTPSRPITLQGSHALPRTSPFYGSDTATRLGPRESYVPPESEFPPVKSYGGLGPFQYIGEKAGERGGIAPAKGVLLRRGKTIEGK